MAWYSLLIDVDAVFTACQEKWLQKDKKTKNKSSSWVFIESNLILVLHLRHVCHFYANNE